ncbi:MAG: M24 family metallopeptidase [Erysipelotrichaceae bacterium]|nr:M24 family metallopeptidase [Erysipelotrichaceae bacterium]MBQ9987583.1 M24 family metallopeptidase [Erysipelotrichales bacterium]MBR3693705.1 M24 family metallopeptidase [Erysipelotrichales bacterium]
MRSVAEQDKIKDLVLTQRLELAKEMMSECGVEAWLIISREYNEDPLFHALTPSHYPTARRITILLLACKGEDYHCYSLSMPDGDLEKYYVRDWDRNNETQMEALTRVLYRIDPKNIAIDVSDNFAYTDGLSAGLYRMLMKELPEDLTSRFVSADDVGIRLLETRTPLERELFPEVMDVAMEIIDNTFSDERIIPGKTSCRDLMDYMEQEVKDRGMDYWFEPTIDLQRHDGMHGDDCVIERGDLLHCDFGIRYMNLCTDTQRLCYVLKEDEEDIPEELKVALKRNNRFQDIVRENMKIGRSGNDVFEMSIAQGKEEGLRPILYTHPLGFHGHAAGPTIGLFSNQNRIPVKGDLLIHNYTGYALELSIVEYLEMYQRDTYIFTEESVVLVDNEVSFLAQGRDTMYVVGKEK